MALLMKSLSKSSKSSLLSLSYLFNGTGFGFERVFRKGLGGGGGITTATEEWRSLLVVCSFPV